MIMHKGTRRIETDRLILRKAIPEDALPLYRNWASDPEVTKFLTWPAYQNPETAHQRIAFLLEQYARQDCYEWMIEWKPLHQIIGSISAVSLDDRVKMAEIGYCIGRSWWRQGIATEALQAVIAFLFDQVGMNRIEAKHDVNNPHSGSVMKKCGMQLEGISRSSCVTNQGLCDMAHYAILKSDRIP